MLFTRFKQKQIVEAPVPSKFFQAPYLDSKYDEVRKAVLASHRPIEIPISKAHKYDFETNTLERSYYDRLTSTFSAQCSPTFDGKNFSVITTHLRQRRIIYEHQSYNELLGWQPTFWDMQVSAYRSQLANGVKIGASLSTESDLLVEYPGGERLGFLFHTDSTVVRVVPVFDAPQFALITFHRRDQTDYETLLFDTEKQTFQILRAENQPIYKSSLFKEQLYFVERRGKATADRELHSTGDYDLRECDFKIVTIEAPQPLKRINGMPVAIVDEEKYAKVRAAVINETEPCFFEGCEELRLDFKKALTRAGNCSNCERNALVSKFIRIGINAIK